MVFAHERKRVRRELSENEREGSNSTTCERGQARVTEGHRHRQRHRHRHLEEREEGDASSDLSNDSLDLVHNVLAKEEGRGRQEDTGRKDRIKSLPVILIK